MDLELILPQLEEVLLLLKTRRNYQAEIELEGLLKELKSNLY